MEHVNGWCFRDIYKGGLWENHLHVSAHPHDRNVTDDLCSLIKLCFSFIMVNFFDVLFYCYSCWKLFTFKGGERGGSVVECRTLEREVRGSRPTAAVLCPWARHFTPRKYWLITQEAMAPSLYDWKIVDWDVKPQHNQLSKVLESLKCITDIDQSVKNRWLITVQVIKNKTMILCICITILIVTFSVIIVSNYQTVI